MTEEKDQERTRRVEVAMEAMKRGEMVILVDDEDRENEGDLCMAAEAATPEAINFMAKEARGLICLTLTSERCQELDLPIMVNVGGNSSVFHTNFTVSVDATEGVTTGISAADRAHTVQVAVDPRSSGADLARPGHIFPLRAEPGGVLVRTGQTEGSVDLCRLAGLYPAGVIVEMMNDDGTMSRMPQLEKFSEKHGLPIVQVADLIHYRMQREGLVQRTGERQVTTRWGTFTGVCFEAPVAGLEMMAFVLGKPEEEAAPLVRVHAARHWTDTFGGMPAGSVADLDLGFEALLSYGSGVLLYIARPTSVGLAKAFADGERPPNAENLHTIGIGAQVLRSLGLSSIRLVSRRPKPVRGVRGFGIEVVEIIDPRRLCEDPDGFRSADLTH
jgi:3,4-dihydroxy 2-butanone 4-phosphate synthase/GTP cyclohydrolase II